MILGTLTLLILGGLLLIRSQPVAPVTPMAGATASLAPGERSLFEAANGAFRLALPQTWVPAFHDGAPWFFVRVDDAASLPPTETGDPHLRLRLLSDAPAVLIISYGPIGDPERAPEDALSLWMTEAEFWLPWQLLKVESPTHDPQKPAWQTRTVGPGRYPAAQEDFIWQTPRGERRARLIVIKAYDQTWAWLVYAWPELWKQVQQEIEYMLSHFRPAIEPPPLGEP